MEKSVPLDTKCDVLRNGHASVAADASVLHPVKEIQDKVRWVFSLWAAACCGLGRDLSPVSTATPSRLQAFIGGVHRWYTITGEVHCLSTSSDLCLRMRPTRSRVWHGQLTDESFCTNISAAPLPFLLGATPVLRACISCALSFCFLPYSGSLWQSLLCFSLLYRSFAPAHIPIVLIFARLHVPCWPTFSHMQRSPSLRPVNLPAAATRVCIALHVQWSINAVHTERQMLAATHGAALPLSLMMEERILGQFHRLGSLRSEFVGLESLSGRDQKLTFEDVLGDPAEGVDAPRELHSVMEAKLGMSMPRPF